MAHQHERQQGSYGQPKARGSRLLGLTSYWLRLLFGRGLGLRWVACSIAARMLLGGGRSHGVSGRTNGDVARSLASSKGTEDLVSERGGLDLLLRAGFRRITRAARRETSDHGWDGRAWVWLLVFRAGGVVTAR